MAIDVADPGVAIVLQFEGLRLVAYRDACGFWTIGVGHLVTRDPRAPAPAPITRDQAIALLEQDLARAGGQVIRLVPAGMTAGQFKALRSFVFNLGGGALKASTLRRRILAGDIQGAAAEFPKWCIAGGRKLPGLLARRLAERALFLSAIRSGS